MVVFLETEKRNLEKLAMLRLNFAFKGNGKLSFYSYVLLFVFTLTPKFETWVSKFQIEK